MWRLAPLPHLRVREGTTRDFNSAAGVTLVTHPSHLLTCKDDTEKGKQREGMKWKHQNIAGMLITVICLF